MLDRFGDAPGSFVMQLFLTCGQRGPWNVFQGVRELGWLEGRDYNFIFINL